jgi:predicted anti-sigma-YlaC factor YlaD
MNTKHLSAWEQEEYVLQQGADSRPPQVLHHLTECAACREAVSRLNQGVSLFRRAAVEWSAECLATRPQQWRFVSRRRLPALGWAIAALAPIVVLLFALLLPHFSSPRPSQR